MILYSLENSETQICTVMHFIHESFSTVSVLTSAVVRSLV